MSYVPSAGGGIDQPDYSITFVKFVVLVLHLENYGSLDEPLLLNVLDTIVVKIIMVGRQISVLQNHINLLHLTGSLCFNN